MSQTETKNSDRVPFWKNPVFNTGLSPFLTAIRFLTIIPVPGRDESFKKSISFFPLVGVLVGLILAGINLLLSQFLPEAGIMTILIAVLALLTGGLHLDGVADTFDALAAGGNREDKLRIMRESHVGAIGVVAVVSLLLLRFGGLISVPPELISKTLVLMPVLGRWSLATACTFCTYSYEDKGKASVFMGGGSLNYFLIASAFTLITAVICFGWKGPLIVALAAVPGLLIVKFLTRIFGGLSGDNLGMLNESVEVISLFMISGILG